MPHPLLETDTLKCIHQGTIILTSSTKELFNINNAGVISLQDLANASIACPNPITSGGPCTKIANIPQTIASTLLEIDSQKIVLCENISLVTTDKGSPLILQGSPKAQGFFEIEEGLQKQANHNKDIGSVKTTTLDSNSQGCEAKEEVAETLGVSQGIRIASNDNAIALELLATNPQHHFNCPDVESGSFIQNLRGFGGVLDFLENVIYNTGAILDYDNLKVYESYNTAEYKSSNIYAKNKCLSKRIKTIYTKDWLSTLAKERQRAYYSDLHIFMEQWKNTLQENHHSIQSFVASFCKKVGCSPIAINEQISDLAQLQFDVANATISVKRWAMPLSNQIALINTHLLPSVRQWYIISRSQYNSFDALLQDYMRYIEINIRYFYVYDESDRYFYTQICVNDLKKLRGMI